jgi:Tfp pilus assembly protein PilV
MATFHINKKIKKGQSLVEVMVAMFVLMLVFVSAVTLVMESLDLVMMARTKTEVAAIAQRAMTESTLQIKSSCPTYNGTPLMISFTSTGGIMVTPVNTYTIGVTLVSPVDLPASGATQGYAYSFTSSGIYEVNVAVTWTDKGAKSPSIYTLKQIVSQQ